MEIVVVSFASGSRADSHSNIIISCINSRCMYVVCIAGTSSRMAGSELKEYANREKSRRRLDCSSAFFVSRIIFGLRMSS